MDVTERQRQLLTLCAIRVDGAGVDWSLIARQAQFVAHRDAIEQIASDLYDEAPRFKGYVVRIFTKHIHGA